MNLSPNHGLRFLLLPPNTSLRSLTIFLQSFTIKHSSLLEILNAFMIHDKIKSLFEIKFRTKNTDMKGKVLRAA